MNGLGTAQIAAYRESGYLELRNVFDPALLQRLVATTERLSEAGRSLTAKTRRYDLDPTHSAAAPRIRRISSPTELDQVYVEVAFESVLGDIAQALIGGPVRFYHSKINFKLPGGGAEIGWHQDWPVFPHQHQPRRAQRTAQPVARFQRLPAHDPRHASAGPAQPLARRALPAQLQCADA